MNEFEWLVTDKPGDMIAYLLCDKWDDPLAVDDGRKYTQRQFRCFCLAWRLEAGMPIQEGDYDTDPATAVLVWRSMSSWAAYLTTLSSVSKPVQADIFRDIFNPFRQVALDRVHDRTALSLAMAVYNGALQRDYGRLDADALAVLADAAEEAGRVPDPILRHLRGWSPCYYCIDNPAISLSKNEYCTYCGHERWIPSTFRPLTHHRGCWALDYFLQGVRT